MFESKHEELIDRMMSFSRMIRQIWASRMSDIPGGERLAERDWSLLEWLAEAGEVPFADAVRVGSGNATSAGGSQAAVTAAIGRMTKDLGLLKTKRTKEDERKKTVSLSEKGRKLLEQRTAVRKEMYRGIIECWQPFRPEDCKTLTRLFMDGLKRVDEVFGSSVESG